MRVIAAIPVHGRNRLVKWTINRLLEKNGCYAVVCSGNLYEDKKVCEAAGAIWVEQPNILGMKWNAAFRKANELNAEAVLFVGSSDWVCDDYLEHAVPLLEQGGMVGRLQYMAAHIHHDQRVRLGTWLGYKGPREGEPIGIGRLLSKEALNAIEWKPFHDNWMNCMDYQMYSKLNNKMQKVVIMEEGHGISISTDWWGNMHHFGECASAHGFIEHPDAERFLREHYPEIFKI